MTSYKMGFAYLAKAYANRAIPEDEGKWEFVGPPDCDHSIEEILAHFAGSEEIMPAEHCGSLGLPEGARYGNGVQQICESSVHPARLPSEPS